jgi:hypothetical protein
MSEQQISVPAGEGASPSAGIPLSNPQAGETGASAGEASGPNDRSERERSVADDPRNSGERERARRRDALQRAIASTGTEQAAATEAAFESSRDVRAELSELLPGTPPDELVEMIEAIEAGLQSAPYETTEALARWGLRQPPRFRPDKPKVPRDDSAHGALKRALGDAGDREAYAGAMRKYGPRLDHVLRQTAGSLKMLIDDPLRGAERIAATYGLPVTETQRAEAQAAVAQQAEFAQASSGVERVIASGALPELERLEVQTMVTDILESPHFAKYRTGDRATDLQNAYRIAMEQARRTGLEAVSRKAGLSVVGAPSQATEVATRAKPAGSTRQALLTALEAAR